MDKYLINEFQKCRGQGFPYSSDFQFPISFQFSGSKLIISVANVWNDSDDILSPLEAIIQHWNLIFFQISKSAVLQYWKLW